jgi:hypothetical protein
MIINSKNHGIKEVLVDEDDLSLLNGYTLSISKSNKTFYVYVYKYIDGKRFSVSLHRFLLNPAKGQFIDHKNMNGLDNRRANLRVCTRNQNLFNKSIYSSNTTGFKGVSPKKWRRSPNKFSVTLRVNGKTIYGGYYRTAVEAAKKYNELAIKHHGEFAYQNVIPL